MSQLKYTISFLILFIDSESNPKTTSFLNLILVTIYIDFVTSFLLA